VVRRRELERALAEAVAKRLAKHADMLELLGRHGQCPGAGRLRALLASGEPALTRSEAEEGFLTLIRKAQLRMPDVNVAVCGYEVDFFWRQEQFVVEIDGFAFHGTADRFESDRRRDAVLAAAGVRVMRVTWRQLEREPRRCSSGWHGR
jgi:very-short-patch-repair endonuclease